MPALPAFGGAGGAFVRTSVLGQVPFREAVADTGAKAAMAEPKMRVLIVDDEVSSRFTIERRLRKAEMEPWSTSTVRSAIDKLRTDAFDAVLCDVRTPGGDGELLIQWIASNTPSTKIIVCSAEVTDEFRKTYASLSGLEILEKPVELDRLVQALEKMGPRRGFFGNSIEVELFDYVQMIALTGRDKLIEVETPRGTGRIWFEHGDVVHVEYDQYRGEMAFYKLLATGRGVFREVYNRPPPMRTVVRSSTHLLMEAARQQDEGILGQVASGGKAASEARSEGRSETRPEEHDETSFEDLNETDPPAPPRSKAPPPRPVVATKRRVSTPRPPSMPPRPKPPVATPVASERSGSLPIPEDPIVKPKVQPPSLPADGEASGSRLRPIGAPVFDEQDLAILDDLAESDEIDEMSTAGEHEILSDEPPTEEIPTGDSSTELTAADSMMMHGAGVGLDYGRKGADEHASALAEERSEPVPAGESTPGGASGPASHAIFEDPDMRQVMLEQFWQFEGINGVAIISSTGKVLAEDMRNNSSLVTLAGFYMRGAARIARTLGHNVFDGVVARSLNGQQMVMVGMGAASAVLSVEPDADPEQVRDAVMGVE